MQNLHLAGRGHLRAAIPDDGDHVVILSTTSNWQARLAEAD